MEWEPEADLAYGEKIQVLRAYASEYKLTTMVETGLYNGSGSGMQMRDLIEQYIVVDIDIEQIKAAKSRGADKVWWGDSAEQMPRLLRTLDGPALFWLDAHLVAEAGEQNSSSLSGELAAILAWPHAAASVILIDDLRMFGREGWPTLTGLREQVAGWWELLEADDIMRLTPLVATPYDRFPPGY